MQFLKKLSLILIYRLIGPTIKLINDPNKKIAELKKSNPRLLFCVWHETTFYCFYFYKNRKACALMEASKKGDVLAAMANNFGFKDFRITDNTGDRTSVKGTIRFIKYIKEGHDGVIAIDGPNGPYHIPKPGAFQIAQKSESIIVPVGVWYSKKIILKNRWDKYQFPLPFSKCIVQIGDPIALPSEFNETSIAAKTKELGEVVSRLADEAEKLGLSITNKPKNC